MHNIDLSVNTVSHCSAETGGRGHSHSWQTKGPPAARTSAVLPICLSQTTNYRGRGLETVEDARKRLCRILTGLISQFNVLASVSVFVSLCL